MSAPDSPQAFATEFWCAGLPLASRRPLDDAERARIAAQASRLMNLLVAIAMLAVATLAWPFVFAATPGGNALFQSFTWAGLLWFASWVLFLPACLVLGRDVRRNWARRAADLRAGEAFVFAGRVPDEPQRTREQRRLIRLGALTPWPNEDQQLVVFATSRSVHVLDSRGRDRFLPAWVHEVAPAPAYAYRVRLPQNFLRVAEQPELQFERRSLAEGEVAELRAYVRQLRRIEFSQVLAALLVVYAISRAIAWTRTPVAPERALGDALSAAFAAFVGGWMMKLFAKRLRFSARLARDVATGWALTLKRNETGDVPAPASSTPPPSEILSPSPPDAPPVEFLPHSGAVWMDRGRPARWRDLKRAA